MIILITYWIITTIVGTIYFAYSQAHDGSITDEGNPSPVTLLELMGYLLISVVFAPFVIPFVLMQNIIIYKGKNE